MRNKKNRTIIKRTNIIIIIIMLLIIFITLYPFLYVISMSFSDPPYVLSRQVYLFPKGFSLKAYKMILSDQTVLQSFGNSIWYTFFGTVISLVTTLMTAYVLSKKTFFLRRSLTFLMTLTMFINGGLIPLYIVVSKLNLYNSRWSIILPYAISAYNLIITRSYFDTLPEELSEAAKMDGASEFKIMYKIFFPLSRPIISVLILFYGVGYWNSYFAPLIFLANEKLQPIQLYLRSILITSQMTSASQSAGIGIEGVLLNEQLKYACIVISCFPIMILYPFLQKYFEKGVLIGAVKS